MRKLIISLIVILFQLEFASAQLSIETRLCYSDTTRFNFTGEWQYLSTDIYLFNGNKFSRVINELDNKSGKRKKGLSEEQLEYLYITAQLINVRFFGDNNVVYPLYNFRINKDKENKYQTLVSDNIESIRIIDNLPLYSANDKIDAKIDVNAITHNDRDNIFGVIGAQLRNLANLMIPSNAVLSLIGEMGSFIESNSKKKEYKFSSTIRLFEQKNFDTRLHSIRIYAITAQTTPAVRLNDIKLKRYFDTCNMPELSRGMLDKLIGYQHYPLIVVANYKSLYRMASISGDEVSFANIDKRKVQIENNYSNKLISEETYRQERDFITFLTIFANFKSQLELYTLNARMANVEATFNALGTTTQQYCSLLESYEKINYKYRNNKTFSSVFQSEYKSILDFADFYLENDHNLRAAKSMVSSMYTLNSDGIPQQPSEIEAALRNLRFIDNMSSDFKTKAKDAQTINILIRNLENSLMTKSFNADIQTVKTMSAVSEKAEVLQRLKERMGTTHCITCRDKAMESIKSYNNRYEEYIKRQILRTHDSIVIASRADLNEYMSLYKNLSLQFNQIPNPLDGIGNDTTLFQMQYIQISRKLTEVSNGIEDLGNFINYDVKDKSIDIIESLDQKINDVKLKTHENITFVNTSLMSILTVPIPQQQEVIVEEETSGLAPDVIQNQ